MPKSVIDHIAGEPLLSSGELSTPSGLSLRWSPDAVDIGAKRITSDTPQRVQLSRSLRFCRTHARHPEYTLAPVLLLELRATGLEQGPVTLSVVATVEDPALLTGLPELHRAGPHLVSYAVALAVLDSARLLGAEVTHFSRGVFGTLESEQQKEGSAGSWARIEDPHRLRFCDERARVCIDGLWGYVNPEGALVIPARFQAARDFGEGLAAVQVDGSWGYIDSNGDFVRKPDLERALTFTEGRALARESGGWMILDPKGQIRSSLKREIMRGVWSAAFPVLFSLAWSLILSLAVYRLILSADVWPFFIFVPAWLFCLFITWHNARAAVRDVLGKPRIPFPRLKPGRSGFWTSWRG